MLGITVADAVLVVGLGLSLLAAWTGTQAGKVAKKESPPPGVFSVAGLGIVDTMALQANTAALHRLAEAIDAAARDLAGEKNAERRHEELLDEMKRPRTST